MRSLRGRLGAMVAGGTLLVTLVSGVLISYERWQEQASGLDRRVELAAFQLSETGARTIPEVAVGGGNSFALVLDAEAGVLGESGDIDDDLLDVVIDDVWSQTTEQDTVITTIDHDAEGRRRVVSGVACVDQDRCDSVVVGATEERFIDYLSDRWAWLVGPALLATLVALGTARWLVGRSLRPVDRMRRELDSITETDLERRVPVPATGDELESLGSSLNQTIARLGAAVAANQRFVADAAHELRSPITGVRAALEVEAARTEDGLLADSADELDRASRLIDDLLTLARGQSDTRRRHDVDLDDITRDEIAAFRTRFPDATIARQLEPVRIRGDSDALRRVVANLLDNAHRHGGGRVAIELMQHADRCRLTIDDDGAGVPIEDRQRIFERFARLDTSRSRRTGGSGLGLAIVGEIVKEHRGTVTVDDSELGGARFTVVLPIG